MSDMTARIREYVSQLFADAPRTQKARDLQEEVCANLLDKYADLLSQGVPEERAFDEVVGGIGEIDELIRGLKGEELVPEDPRAKRRSALLVSIAVMLYILSVTPVILAESDLSVVGMFAMIAVATMLLIYNHMTRPKYQRADDTMVEEFKEWKQEKEHRESSLYRAIAGAVWALILIAYFCLSFFTGAWEITWVLFLIGIAAQQIVRAVLSLRK